MFARHFWEIEPTLGANAAVRDRFLALVGSQRFPAKALEGGTRHDVFNDLLASFGAGKLSLDQLSDECETQLPPSSSPYASSNQVFGRNWGERLVRTQISCFYNQAVLELVLEQDGKGARVYVAHSPAEKPSSRCTQQLVGKSHYAAPLLAVIRDEYRKGNWNTNPITLPEHPHCTHTFQPKVTND